MTFIKRLAKHHYETFIKRNYAPESPTFGVILEVSQTGVQWKGLVLEGPPRGSRCLLCQVSMPDCHATIRPTSGPKAPTTAWLKPLSAPVATWWPNEAKPHSVLLFRPLRNSCWSSQRLMLIGNGLDMFGVIAGDNRGNPREHRPGGLLSNPMMKL